MVSPVLFLEEEKMIRYVVDAVTSVEGTVTLVENFGIGRFCLFPDHVNFSILVYS